MAIRFQRSRASLVGIATGQDNRLKARMFMFKGLFALLFAVLAMRMFDVSILQAPLTHIEKAGRDMQQVAVKRGDILDRNGRLLARSLPMPSVYANPSLILEPAKLASDLQDIFPSVNAASLAEGLAKPGQKFLWVKRGITPEQQKQVLTLGQPGLGFITEDRRFYPHGALGAHFVGYVDVDSRGLAGLERSTQDVLESGQDVQLTLDIRLQHALKRAIDGAIKDFNAKAGAGVIMDVRNGEVLGAVSLPDFDPHRAGQASPEALFNRLSLGAYELGSLFKIFSTAALLEFRDVMLDHPFDVREPLKIGRQTIRDYHPENRILTVPEVFIYSSNIGSALMGQMVGTDLLRRFYRDLGLLTRLQTDIAETARPIVPSPWREIDTLTAAFGHGGATSVLQVAGAVGSIVNGGLKITPHFIKRDESETAPHMRVLSEENAVRMRQLLELVVKEGTAKKAFVPGYEVGGKTGTAEKIGPDGQYNSDALISSFVGVFPVSDPRYLVLIMIDEPQGTDRSFGFATAGWVAAPAVAEVITSMAAILNIPPVNDGHAFSSAPLRQYITLDEEDGDGD